MASDPIRSAYMLRNPRVEFSGSVCPVICRGDRREAIFLDGGVLERVQGAEPHGRNRNRNGGLGLGSVHGEWGEKS